MNIKKKLLISIAGITLFSAGNELINRQSNFSKSIVYAAKSKKKRVNKNLNYSYYKFSGIVTIKNNKRNKLPLYNNSLTKVTTHLHTYKQITVSATKKIHGKVVAYRYKNNQWILRKDIATVKVNHKAPKKVKLASNFKAEKVTFKVIYNGAYLMNKNGKKINQINKGKIVKLIGVGQIKASRAWQLKDGTFIYAKYLGSVDTPLSINNQSNDNSCAEETLDTNIANQLKNPNVALLTKYSLVKNLTGKQHDLAEKLLMDQMGVSLGSSSRFDSIMNNTMEVENEVNNWIH